MTLTFIEDHCTYYCTPSYWKNRIEKNSFLSQLSFITKGKVILIDGLKIILCNTNNGAHGVYKYRVDGKNARKRIEM